jgi:hypothetical protein
VGFFVVLGAPAATTRAQDQDQDDESEVPAEIVLVTDESAGSSDADQPEERRPAMDFSAVVDGVAYDAYIETPKKDGQFAHYTCEFDAGWVILKTYGIDAGLQEQVDIIGMDESIEPYYEETADGIFIYGGDIKTSYSGDYNENFLARTSGLAMREVFEHYDLNVTPVRDREGIEDALLNGELVWIKTTVDFLEWTPATWVNPDGTTFRTVLGNDHAVVVVGFNDDGVVIRDVLGPTSSNWERVYRYNVSWDRFLASWGAQDNDGLAVAPPEDES